MPGDRALPDRSGQEAELVGPTLVTDPRTIDAICRFRAAVWIRTGLTRAGAFPDGRWRDRYEEASRHWAIRYGGEIVAAARLSLHERLEEVPEADEYLAAGLRLEGPAAAPARVVVARPWRRHGLAARLIQAQDRAAAEAGAAFGVTQSAPAMRRVRERHGWRRAAPAAPDDRFPAVAFEVMVRGYGGPGEPPG